jgi:hypothetical protein
MIFCGWRKIRQRGSGKVSGKPFQLMKKLNLVVLTVAAALLFTAGCKKNETVQAPQFQGVTVDLPKLNDAFANTTSQDIKTTVTQVGFNLRYQKYEDALMSLDKLANDPAVTDAQKKVVAEIIEQTKKLASAPAPAQ